MTVPTDDEGLLRVNRSCAIPLRELTWKFTASGGPGGQHANTANTKVDLRFDIEESESLGTTPESAAAREAWAIGARSRRPSAAHNYRTANSRSNDLRTILQEALAIERHRVATKPSRTAKVKRVESKRRRSEVKRGRQRPDDDS